MHFCVFHVCCCHVPFHSSVGNSCFLCANIRGNTAHKANQCLHNDDKPESQYLVFFFNMWTLNSIRQVFSKQLSGIVTRKHSGRTPGQLLLTCFLRAFKKVEGSCVSFCVLVCLWSWPHAAVLPLNSSPHISLSNVVQRLSCSSVCESPHLQLHSDSQAANNTIVLSKTHNKL